MKRDPIRFSATNKRILIVLGVGILSLAPLACGESTVTVPQPGRSVEQILQETFGKNGTFVPVTLDTAAIAGAVQAGHPVQLPFKPLDGALTQRQVQLTLRNLRGPELTEFVLKDGVQQVGRTLPLPPPATYQGVVVATAGGHPGAAVLTITPQVVEGNLLVAPEGWSMIEPLEPLLRLYGVDAAERARVLHKYNHIVYNAKETAVPSRVALVAPVSDPPGHPTPVERAATAPLVLSIVGDGDAELFDAYPLDSVMPFWLKQESLFNAVDWLYNCIEPDANADNAYTTCDNDFDGGSGALQARLRIDRLETWTAGGPQSPNRIGAIEESAQMTHQSTPVCCGEPHTAGRSALVHFFSGRVFTDGAGYASVGGLNVYGEGCLLPGGQLCCHHAVSQIVPGREFPGTLFFQQQLVAHEIGHNNGGAEDLFGFPQEWLFGLQSGTTLMRSNPSFTPDSLFLYSTEDAENVIGPLLQQRLEHGPDTTVLCTSGPLASAGRPRPATGIPPS